MLAETKRYGRDVAIAALVAVRRPITQRRFHAATTGDGPFKIVIGAGPLPIDGWINTDVSPHATMYLDLLKEWPLKQGSVGWIFGDNVIEHLSLKQGRVALQHAFSALGPGGRIRLATPDVEASVRAYVDPDPKYAQAYLDRHTRHGYFVEHPVDLLRVIYAESGHHVGYCYDFTALASELERAGFIDVTRHDPGKSDDPEFTGLEAPERFEDSPAGMTLIVEATKPQVVP